MNVVGSKTGITRKQLISSLTIGDGNFNFHTTKTGILRTTGVSTYASVKYKDYYEWKKSLLQECFPRLSVRETVIRNSVKVPGYSDVLCASIYNTDALSRLTPFLYSGNKRKLSHFLNRINHPLLLSIWFMDDGCCSSSRKKHIDKVRMYISKPQFTLSTHRYTRSENEQAIKWFREKWGITAVLQPRCIDGKVKDYSLRFPSSEGKKIWQIIRPYVLKFNSMIYRFRFYVHFYEENGTNDDLSLSTLCKYGIKCFRSPERSETKI